MKAFADLLDRLSYSPSRNTKLRLMQEYFRATPDPDRGWALASLTDGLPFSFPLRRTLTDMMARRYRFGTVWSRSMPLPRPSKRLRFQQQKLLN